MGLAFCRSAAVAALVCGMLLAHAASARAAGQLTYSPAEPMLVMGNQGGVYAPLSKVYTLSNTGNEALNWGVTFAVPWLQASPSSGTLAAGQSVQTTITLDNAYATQWAPGYNLGPVAIGDLTNNLNQTLRVIVTSHSATGVPPGDNIADAPPLLYLGFGGTALRVRVGQATHEPGEPQHAGQNGTTSVWVTAFAPYAGYGTFDTIGSDVDTVLAAYTPFDRNARTYDRILPLAANDDLGAGQTASRLRIYMAPGDEILLAIDAKTAGATGTVQLNWRYDPPEISPIVSAILPASRATTVGSTVTAFATMINSRQTPLTGCGIGKPATLYGTFAYQTTNAQNVPIGTPNTPVNLPAGAAQTFVMAFTPQWHPLQAYDPPDRELWPEFVCQGIDAGIQFRGLNTFTLSSLQGPTADIIPIISTPSNDGFLTFPSPSSSIAFSAAGINVATAMRVLVRLEYFANAVFTLCETDRMTGQCLGPASINGVTVDNWLHNEVRTFAAFGTALGPIPDDAFRQRIFVTFTGDGGSFWPVGSTSVALRTQAP